VLASVIHNAANHFRSDPRLPRDWIDPAHDCGCGRWWYRLAHVLPDRWSVVLPIAQNVGDTGSQLHLMTLAVQVQKFRVEPHRIRTDQPPAIHLLSNRDKLHLIICTNHYAGAPS